MANLTLEFDMVSEQKEHILKEKPYMCLSLTLGELKNVSKNIQEIAKCMPQKSTDCGLYLINGMDNGLEDGMDYGMEHWEEKFTVLMLYCY